MDLARPALSGGAEASPGSRWKLIVRSVLRQRSRNLLLGMLVFFASLVIVYFSQFLEGVSRNFSHNLIRLASGELYVSSAIGRAVDRNIFDRDYEYFRASPALRNEIKSAPGVVSLAERLEFDAKLATELDTIPYRVMAIDAQAEPQLVANFDFVEGRMVKPGEFGIALPRDFARRHKIAVGDSVRVLAKATNRQINLIDYTVTGLFATRSLSAWFDNYAYLDLAAARVLVNDKEALTRLNINLAEGTPTEGLKARFESLLQQHRDASNPAIAVTHWSEGTAVFAELTGAMQLSYSIVIGIIVIMVAASLAFSTMMNILERTKEIATLGALGAAPRTIRAILVGENLVLAGLAACAGLLRAALLYAVTARYGIPISSKELSGFLGSSHFYPAFNVGGYLAGLLVPLVVALLASFLFAHRAARLPIAAALADR